MCTGVPRMRTGPAGLREEGDHPETEPVTDLPEAGGIGLKPCAAKALRLPLEPLDHFPVPQESMTDGLRQPPELDVAVQVGSLGSVHQVERMGPLRALDDLLQDHQVETQDTDRDDEPTNPGGLIHHQDRPQRDGPYQWRDRPAVPPDLHRLRLAAFDSRDRPLVHSLFLSGRLSALWAAGNRR